MQKKNEKEVLKVFITKELVGRFYVGGNAWSIKIDTHKNSTSFFK